MFTKNGHDIYRIFWGEAFGDGDEDKIGQDPTAPCSADYISYGTRRT